MKSSLLLLLILICTLPSVAKRTVLTGEVSRKGAGKEVSLYYYGSPLDELEHTRTSLSTPIINNRYRFELDISQAIKVYMRAGEDWLTYDNYIAPGDSLVLSYSDSSESFDGKCGECNFLIFLKQQTFYGDPAVRERNQKARSLPPDAFMQHLTRFRKTALHLLDSISLQSPLPEDFKRHYRNHVDFYHYGVELAQYTWAHPELMKNNSYLALIRNIPLNNPEALVDGGYIHFLRELPYASWRALYYMPGIDALTKDYYNLNSHKVRDSFAKQYFTGVVYDVALYQILKDDIRRLEEAKGSPVFDSLYEKHTAEIQSRRASFTEPSYYNSLISRLEQLKAVKAAPDFTLEDLDGNTVRLSDFKGKVVYLDFWATNCAPCVKEIPHIKPLQEEFRDEDVVFLFISVGDRKEPLKSFLKTKSFEGKHLIAPEGFGSEVAKRYNINSLPRYLIVDRNGFIFNSDAPRPSSKPQQVLQAALEKM